MNQTHTLPRPRGFTLIELLVVMTIIGILMAILVPAIYYARIAALNATITMEISQLTGGMEEYKNSFGDYPPNFDNALLLNRHLSKRQRLSSAQLTANASDNGIPQFPELVTGGTHAIDPAEALVFWLGGQSPVSGSSFQGGGLRNNPVAPLQPAAGPGEPKSFFDFVQTRLIDRDNDGWLEYAAPSSMGAPYVYFENRSYGSYSGGFALPSATNDSLDRGKVSPLGSLTPPSTYQEPTRFQIIAPGQDGLYGDGSAQVFPVGPFQTNDQDNLSNFSGGRTFKDSMP